MGDLKLGSSIITLKLGSTDVSAAYVGNVQVYGGTPPTPTITDYLAFTATENGTFKFSGNSINYSLDSGSTWTSLASNTDSPTVAAGDKIMWKATLTPSSYGIGTFSSTSAFTVEGNVMSLLYGDDFEDKVSLQGKNNAFRSLFIDCTSMTSAENLQLPATTLAYGCYEQMFRYCINLTSAPELPATTLENSCYSYMFQGCSSLNSITCLATDISASSCLFNWVNGVSKSGTFTKAASMTSWTIGLSGIPKRWTVVDYSG